MTIHVPASRVAPLLCGLALVAWLATGCGPSQMNSDVAKTKKDAATGKPADDHKHAEGEHGHDHAHPHVDKGPHGGTIVVVAGHHAHLELVLEEASGKLTAYVLDDQVKNPAKFKQDKLVIAFVPEEHHHADAKDEKAEAKKADEELKDIEEITLTAVNAADGEASEFAGQSDKLKGVDEFDGTLISVNFEGKEYKEVRFEFPLGNEHMAH